MTFGAGIASTVLFAGGVRLEKRRQPAGDRDRRILVRFGARGYYAAAAGGLGIVLPWSW